MKTNKHQTLLLVKSKQTVRARDLVEAFGYSAPTARSYLSHLKRQELLERSERGHGLTDKGLARLEFFDVSGCADPACPLCRQKAGLLTCPRCSYQLSKEKLRILPEQDFLVVVRHAGVYCHRCWKLLFSEAQAHLMGIPKEAA
ncbi:MAG TPA: FaeA/PapI family transcriptional regulator [Nitrospiraceae bacterium]|nr:FaeA/PapI family transcriptional regulator [Nitrospiraceae bacterium]